MFCEWLLDSWCQYLDLEASLALVRTQGCVERADSTFLLLESYSDMLTLWEARIRYCVEKHGADDMSELLERLNDDHVDWSDYSNAVCSFRLLSMKNSDECADKSLKAPRNVAG